ncbi:MAG: PTS sugar transporter subunit IIA [Candidatus Omnitrophica bacterium]|nr:PTS sugar transporter subunit IIA [Candidatus Omnitrophota bacterium]MCB9721927.1 PTS sugar transporter subunit IIA [Candidatus Omnitrophota bacterium]
MSRIADFLSRDLVFPDMQATTKEEAVAFLVNALYSRRSAVGGAVGRDDCLRMLMERENLQSTALGDGIAFPHARIEGWKEFVLLIGISAKGIDFGAADQGRVHIVCLMVSSLNEPYTVLQAMSALSHFFLDAGLPQKIRLGGQYDWSDIQQLLLAQVELTGQVVAEQVMRPVLVKATLDMDIKEATRLMHLHKMDILPVVDSQDRLMGEVTCRDVLRMELPDFFRDMTTISFIRHIDPFEQYFTDKKNLRLEEAVLRKVTPVSGQATLIELIFLLAIKDQAKLYITDDSRRLVGIVDRFTIIDKILFL